MQTTHECCLCSQIEGRQANDLIARMLPDEPYVRRVMLESRSFAVIPSLGPLVAGHSLLCPKQHIKSFAGVEASLDEEFQEMKRRLTTILREMYGGEICLFEHGMAGEGKRILCTVDHAHMHFVPLPQAFDASVIEQRGWTVFDGSLASLRQLSRGWEYVLYESPDGVCRLLLDPGGELEPQYMRRIVAAGLGRSDSWNWREAPDPSAADEAWRRFGRFSHASCGSLL